MQTLAAEGGDLGTRLAATPVMIPFRHMLVPTDFSETSGRAVDLALELASKFDAKITILHVATLPPHYYSEHAQRAWPTEEFEGKEFDAVVTWSRARYSKIDAMFLWGEPWQCILQTAKERGADLIVMGTHGRRGLPHLLMGSVAEKIARLSPIPVLTVSRAERSSTKHTGSTSSEKRAPAA